VVYSREVDGQEYTFGVSGRLYKSNVLLYDHQTESLWSQIMQKAIAGPLAGKRLTIITSTRTTWKDWKKKHPRTLVLSKDTGYRRDYASDPYKGYYRVASIWFPVGRIRRDLSPKEMVLGIEINDMARAYPLSLLKRGGGTLKDKVGGEAIHIEVDANGQIVGVTDDQGGEIPHIFSYWFAWQAFHAQTTVYGNRDRILTNLVSFRVCNARFREKRRSKLEMK
jgi:hypothetical protein